MSICAIVRVENTKTNQIAIGTTGNFEGYKDNILKYINGKGIANQWAKEHGIEALTITKLEELTPEQYEDTKLKNSKKKQWTYQQEQVFGDLYEVINPYSEAKKERGKVPNTLNVYENMVERLERIEESLKDGFDLLLEEIKNDK
jgi:hypothetical protein